MKANSYCIALQAIYDEKLNHVADELLYRAAGDASKAIIQNHLEATARACSVAFYEVGVERLCGNRTLYFNAPRDWLLNPDLLPPSTENIVIEVLENVRVDEDLLKILTVIKALGYTIALDDFVLTPETQPLLEFADLIKLDILQTPPSKADIDLYHSMGIRLLAEKVETFEIFEEYKKLGCTLFQGYFFSKPEMKSGSAARRGSNTNARMEILRELYQDQVDIKKVEKLLNLEPQLVLRLLKMINSAHYKRVSTISSVCHAITVLGLDKLKTLVTTLVLANDDPCKMILLPKILTRAAMCQKLAKHKFDSNPDEAFIMGLLSLSDIMLNERLAVICEELPVSNDVKAALLDYKGKLGSILLLAIKFETAELTSASYTTIDLLNKFYLESRSWATDSLKGLNG